MEQMNATGQNKEIEMIHEKRYNAARVKGCSGGLNSIVNDCGCRKPSHRSWYKEMGQITGIADGSGNFGNRNIGFY